MGGVGRERRGVERRERIIQAATDVFARRGFRTTSLSDVAEVAGVTPAGILYHFGSKEALLVAVITERDRSYAHILAEPAKGGLAAIESALRFAELYQSQPHLTALHTVLEVESHAPDSPAHEYFRARNSFIIEAIEQALAVSQRAGEIRGDVDCTRIAHQVVAFLHGASVLWLKNPELSLVELYRDFFESLIEVLVDDVAVAEPTPPNGVRSDRRGVERRRRIIDSATAVFTQRGWKVASLSEVAEQAGLTAAGILYHFGSKEELLLAVIRDRDARQAPVLDELERGGGLTWIASAVRFAELAEQEPKSMALHTVLEIESLDPESPAHHYFELRNRALLSGIEARLRRGQLESEVADSIDCARTARQVVAFLHGAAVLWLGNPQLSLVELYTDYFHALARKLPPR